MKIPAQCLSMCLSGSTWKGSKIYTKVHHTLPGKVWCHNIFFHKYLYMYCSIHRTEKCHLLASWMYYIASLLYPHHTSRWCFWPPVCRLTTSDFCWETQQNCCSSSQESDLDTSGIVHWTVPGPILWPWNQLEDFACAHTFKLPYCSKHSSCIQMMRMVPDSWGDSFSLGATWESISCPWFITMLITFQW